MWKYTSDQISHTHFPHNCYYWLFSQGIKTKNYKENDLHTNKALFHSSNRSKTSILLAPSRQREIIKYLGVVIKIWRRVKKEQYATQNEKKEKKKKLW